MYTITTHEAEYTMHPQRGKHPSRCNVNAFYHMQKSIAPYKAYWQHVSAILPAYLMDESNGTLILYDDGSIEQVNHTIKYVLDDWLSYHQSSTDTLRKQSMQWLGSKNQRRVPMILGHNLCLLPVQVRKGRSRNHAMTGYVILNKVKNIYTRHSFRAAGSTLALSDAGDYTDNAAVIKFSDQLYLQAIDCKHTVENNLSIAMDMVRHYCAERSLDTMPFFSSSHQPQEPYRPTHEKNL